MELRVLQTGWRRHLRHFLRLRRKFAWGQDPKVFSISCSDSRVNVHEILEMNEPGSIFEVKNIGGLFSEDAKAALVYALAHLRPEFILVMHHTRCGGYQTLSKDVEPEIKKHMTMFGGLHSMLKVGNYIKERRLRLPEEHVEQLILEEGCRSQTQAIVNFLMFDYPKMYKEVKDGRVKILPLLYHTVTGRVCKVPDSLEGSEDMRRQEL
jgi:carbonic anhydrase